MFVLRTFLYVFFFFCMPISLMSNSIDKAIILFEEYENQGQLDLECSIQAIFDACEVKDVQSRRDIVRVIAADRKKISIGSRRQRRVDSVYRRAKERKDLLKRFRAHIKKHKHAYDFLAYSQVLKKRYQHAFGNRYIVEDVYKHPDRYEYSPKKGDRLLRFFKLLKEDLGWISRAETKMHSRYADLKSLNYVYKIECIKLRNEILFHPWYRHRLRDGYELLDDACGPFGYLGRIIFHVIPSLFIALGITISTSLSGPSHTDID